MRVLLSSIRALGMLTLALLACRAGRASAQTRDESAAEGAQRSSETAAASAGAGMFLPMTLGARTDSQRGFFLAYGGYDSARESAQSEMLVDVSLFRWLAIRAGALYTQSPNQVRPTVGLRAQALTQEQAGIDLGFGAFYKPEGFTEMEGEFELVAAVGRSFGRVATFANLVYGQDPEATERDGELRLAALYQVSQSVQAGLDARVRFDLGEEEEAEEQGRAEYDVIFGPTASLAVGPIAATAQVGMIVLGTEPARPGGIGLIGVAGAL